MLIYIYLPLVILSIAKDLIKLTNQRTYRAYKILRYAQDDKAERAWLKAALEQGKPADIPIARIRSFAMLRMTGGEGLVESLRLNKGNRPSSLTRV